MSTRKDIHDRVLNATNKDELAEVYDEWAGDYDKDLIQEMGYQAVDEAARALAANLSNQRATILDAGCGTGLVGQALAQLGYTNIDGLDYSNEMLAQAQAKQVYGKLMQADLMANLDLASDSYGALICVGTFTLGHVGPAAFNEMIRVVRPGGLLCFTVRSEAWEQFDYADILESLVDKGPISWVQNKRVNYIDQDESTCQLCVVKVT